MRPGDPFDAQSNHQHVPILSNVVGAVSDVQCDSGLYGPVTEPLTSVAFQPQTFYVTTLGLHGAPAAPAAVTTSAPWQPTPQPHYIPVSRAHTFPTPTKPPEMTLLFPVCMPSGSEAGHVMSPAATRSATLVTSPPAATSAVNPSMNITKYVACFAYLLLWNIAGSQVAVHRRPRPTRRND